MINEGKRSILGVLVNVIDYEAAVQIIVGAAEQRKPLSVSALAVHGVMTGFTDPDQRFRLNHLDLVVPDGQPVRWALNFLHHAGLRQRVYGPDLTLKVYAEMEKRGLPIYLYGSTPEVLARMEVNLRTRFPGLQVVGKEPSRFRRLTSDEKDALIERVLRSNARLVCVGLGCPRQEVWAYEFEHMLSMPIMAVGAAFDFHAGTKRQAPGWMQRAGLEWLFRLSQEPKRLWRRYLLLNPVYMAQIALQKVGLRRFDSQGTQPVADLWFG